MTLREPQIEQKGQLAKNPNVKYLTSRSGVLLEVVAPLLNVDVKELFELTLPLFQWIIGCQGEDTHEFKWQAHVQEALVQLDGKLDSDMIAAILGTSNNKTCSRLCNHPRYHSQFGSYN